MIETAQAPRVGLAFGEEAYAETTAAIIGEQHRLAKVEDPLRVPALLAEGALELLGFVRHGQAGGSTHHPLAIQGQDEQAFRGLGISGQVTRFVRQSAVV
ncbi:hypothetical protein D3C76_1244270 [compost metagenome]